MAWVPAAIQGVGAVAGAVSGGKGGSSGIPKGIRRTANAGGRMLRGLENRPAEDSVAKFNPDQLAAFQATRDAQGMGAADMLGAQGTAQQLAGGITAEDIARFQSPYTSSVIDAALADIDNFRARRQLGANAEAEAAGAFGGDRQAVYRANIDGEYDRTMAGTVANLRNTGYQSAVSSALQNQQLRLTGNSQLMDMIERRRAAAYGDASALSEVGGQQFGREQAVLDNPLRVGQALMGSAGGAMGGGGGGAPSTNWMQGMVGGLQFGKDIYNAGNGVLWNRANPLALDNIPVSTFRY